MAGRAQMLIRARLFGREASRLPIQGRLLA